MLALADTHPNSPGSTRSVVGYAALFTVFVFLDQLTKWLITESLNTGQVIPVIPSLFNLTLTYNKGAAFGVLGQLPDHFRLPALTLTTLIALAAVTYFFFVDYSHDRLARSALVMILSGAVGNIIDRVRLGAVTDFLDFYIGSYHWPAFNIADSIICVGVVVLIFRPARKRDASKP